MSDTPINPKKAKKLAKRQERLAAATAKAERAAAWDAGRNSPATAELVTPPDFGYDEWLDSDHDFEAFGNLFWIARGPDIKTDQGMMQGNSIQDAWPAGFRGELGRDPNTLIDGRRVRTMGKVRRSADERPLETRRVMLLMSRTKGETKVFEWFEHIFILDTPDETDVTKQQWSSGYLKRTGAELDALDVKYAEYLISR